MPLTSHEMDLIRSSFDKLREDIEPRSVEFYENLFRHAPHLKGMFRDDDITGQGMRFISTLGVIVKNLDHPDAMAQRFSYLGAGHRAMGVQASDFEPMGAALMDTLKGALGDAFTPETHEAWIKAYDAFSTEIIRRGDIPA